MTTPPQGWVGASPDRLHVPRQPVATDLDERDLQADLAARRLTADGRRVRAPELGRLAPRRALTGAAVSVAGVCLGLGTLLLVTSDPSQGPGPVVSGPLPLASAPAETETAPVDPPSLALPAPAPAAVLPTATPTAPGPPPSAAQPVSVVVPITVLNNSNRTGLADRAATRFRRGGWPIRLTGNFTGQIPVTTVYYDAGFEAAARAFADDFEGIARVRPRFETLPARGVVVVLTREFAA